MKTPAKEVQRPVDTGYEMTPQAEDKWVRALRLYLTLLSTQFQAMNPSTENNYNIDDLDSGDETDDDERPRKKIPNWANMKSTLFRASIMRQYQNRSSNPIDDIFYTINPNRDVDLTELFDSMASLHAQKR